LERVFPLAWSLDHAGIFARSVADIRLMLDAMSETSVQPQSLSERPVRVGIVCGFFDENATPETLALNNALAGKLSTAGFDLQEECSPAIFDVQQAILRTILRSETSSIHERLFAQHSATYGPRIRALVETGMLVSAEDYIRAKRLRRKYQREMARLFESFDVLMTPAARGTAPEGITTTGDPVMNGPWTLSDFPTMTLPHAVAANGLPIAIQLTGPPLGEAKLLTIAARIEEVIGFSLQPSNR